MMRMMIVIIVQVQHYDTLMLDPGGPSAAATGAAGEDDLESVGLLRDESHFSQRLSFGSASTRTA